MPNIVLSRVDERLIHGQVGVQWVGFAGANLVLVANDEVAEDRSEERRVGKECRSRWSPYH